MLSLKRRYWRGVLFSELQTEPGSRLGHGSELSYLTCRMEHREGSRQEGLRELSLASFEQMGQFINPVEVT